MRVPSPTFAASRPRLRPSRHVVLHGGSKSDMHLSNRTTWPTTLSHVVGLPAYAISLPFFFFIIFSLFVLGASPRKKKSDHTGSSPVSPSASALSIGPAITRAAYDLDTTGQSSPTHILPASRNRGEGKKSKTVACPPSSFPPNMPIWWYHRCTRAGAATQFRGRAQVVIDVRG